MTIKAANTVDAGSAIEAGGTCAIVDVDAAVGPCPSIHAYARVTTGRIGARGAVVAQRWTNRALVHVQLALRPRVRRWTKTRVFVYPVYAGRPVLAQIPWTVVDVLLAMISAETLGTDALVIQIVGLVTRAAIFTRRWVAGNVLVLAILASVSARAHASRTGSQQKYQEYTREIHFRTKSIPSSRRRILSSYFDEDTPSVYSISKNHHRQNCFFLSIYRALYQNKHIHVHLIH